MRINKFVVGLVLFAPLLGQAAEQAWISDNLQTAVSAEPDINGRFLGTIPAGAAVTLIGLSANGNYAHIKTDNLDGWISARNIQHQESIAERYQKLQQQYNALQAQNTQMSQESEQRGSSVSSLQQQLNAAQAELAKVRSDYVALRRASANVVSIDKRNRELQTQTVALEQENLNLKRTNAQLQEDISQKKMLYGAGLVIAGFILNWLLGLFSFRRRRSSFDDL